MSSHEPILVLCFFGLASGCYRSHEAPATALEGPRLATVQLVTQDGESQTIHLFDRELGIECSFMSDEAGRWRCLPRAHGLVEYEDADCTQPVILVGVDGEDLPDCPPPTYVREAGCTGARFFTHRGRRTVNTVYSRLLGVCQARPLLGVDYVIADLEPVDLELFAEAQPAPIPPGSGVVREELVTDDGSRYAGQLWDRDRDDACFAVAHDSLPGRASCVALGAGGYRVPGCGVSVAIDPPECPVRPGGFAILSTFEECGVRRTELFEVAEPVSEAALRDMSCEPTLEVGPLRTLVPVPWDRAAELTTRRTGEGRLHPLVVESADGASIGRGDFWDDRLDTTCTARGVAGEVLCVPPLVNSFVNGRPNTFSDPECTEHALRWAPPACEPAYVAFLEGCPGDDALAIYEIGEPLDRWYELDGDRCRPAETMAGETMRGLRDPGFARLRRVTR